MPSGWAICLLLRTVTSVNCVGKRCLLQAAAQGHFLTLSNCYLSGPQLKPKCVVGWEGSYLLRLVVQLAPWRGDIREDRGTRKMGGH